MGNDEEIMPITSYGFY